MRFKKCKFTYYNQELIKNENQKHKKLKYILKQIQNYR